MKHYQQDNKEKITGYKKEYRQKQKASNKTQQHTYVCTT